MSTLSVVLRKLPSTYWWANSMELFERLAWYGMFIPLSLYLTGSTETGALGFTQVQKGTLMGTVVMVLYFLPLLTGAIADKFGLSHSKSLVTETVGIGKVNGLPEASPSIKPS